MKIQRLLTYLRNLISHLSVFSARRCDLKCFSGRMKFYLQHLGWVCVPSSAVTLEVLGSSWWTASSPESTLLLFWAFILLIYSLFMHRNITSGPWNIVVSMDKSTLPCMFSCSCTAKVHYFCLITLDWRPWRLYFDFFLSQVVLVR